MKKLVSIRLEPVSIEKLKAISEKNKRSQGQQIEFLIDIEFEKLGLKLEGK